MERANDAPLEKRSNIFDAVRRNAFGRHVLVGVLHSLMLVLRTVLLEIARKLVSVNLCARVGVRADELGKGASCHILRHLHTDFA
ncbi:MAG: hypothetical protein QOE33_471 [Acidobacteriota bacterium]|nr:hypothetical protein [Acidobacteriota bacterium]